MKAFVYIDTLSHINRLLMQENTGDAEHFAEKLGVSRATLYRLLEMLKDYGIEIEYSRERMTYYYLHPNNVRIHLSFAQLSDEEMEMEKKLLRKE